VQSRMDMITYREQGRPYSTQSHLCSHLNPATLSSSYHSCIFRKDPDLELLREREADRDQGWRAYAFAMRGIELNAAAHANTESAGE